MVNPDVWSKLEFSKKPGLQIHVVDLDGALAKSGGQSRSDYLDKATGSAISVGGGIHSLEQIEDYLAVGTCHYWLYGC